MEENKTPETSTAETEEEVKSVHEGMMDTRGKRITPWAWVGTAYFAEGIPYMLAMIISSLMYKRMGISNDKIAFWTGLISLPWVIKPFWGPLVDIYWTKRRWVIWMQLAGALCFAVVAVGIRSSQFFTITMIAFMAMAFASATHDIACDGFYMLGLTKHQQAWFVGIRSTFYRFAMIFCMGGLVWLAGYFESHTGLPPVYVKVMAVPADSEASPTEYVPPTAEPLAGEQRVIVTPFELEIPYGGGERPVFIRLAKPPENNKTVVVNFGYRKGHKGIKLKEGGHFEFTTANWDKPTSAIISTHQNVKTPIEATFWATAGNIPLSWGLVFAFSCVLFVLFFSYHNFILPRPIADKSVVEKRPIIFQPVFWLIVTFGVPAIFCIGLYKGNRAILESAKDKVVAKITGEKPGEKKAPVIKEKSDAEEAGARPSEASGNKEGTLVKILTNKKQMPILLKLTNYAVIVIIIFLFLKFKPTRALADRGFHYTSANSGVPFYNMFISFFQKKGIAAMIAFLLLYRLGEGQLTKMAPIFLIEKAEKGGLALTTQEVGIVYGTVGFACLTIGGILGGWLAATGGLKKWIFWMWAAINLPDIAYVYLSQVRPDDLLTINICVGIEQFGYGIGFTAYMLYMIYIAVGKYKTSHFAITTGLMALGMMIPMMLSGTIQMLLGYEHFFIFVLFCTIPGLITIFLIPLAPEFGKKAKKKPA